MAKSLFHKDTPEKKPAKPTPYDLIEKEVAHLKKGASVRRSPKEQVKKSAPWFAILVAGCLVTLFCWDPPVHAWQKGEAIRTYLYLHNYTSGPLAQQLASTRILAPDEIDTLNRRQGSFQGYYPSPEAAQQTAQGIINYMNSVRALRAGQLEKLDPIDRTRYLFFVKPGLGDLMPTQWDFLDPTVGN